MTRPKQPTSAEADDVSTDSGVLDQEFDDTTNADLEFSEWRWPRDDA